MEKHPDAVSLGKMRAENLRKKLGSDEALKEHMRQVRECRKALAMRRGYREMSHVSPHTLSRKSPPRPSQAIVDGEAVVIENGRTNFSELQAALAGGRQGRIEYYAFDLLYLDRYDLRAVAQIERKRLLKELFDATRLCALASTSPATARRCSRTRRNSTGRESFRRTPPRRPRGRIATLWKPGIPHGIVAPS